MKFRMLETGRGISESDVERIESDFGIKLPAEYKDFLCRYNGGVPEPSGFFIHGFKNNSKGVIQEFMGINQEILSSNLEWNWSVYKGRLPSSVFPIARTGTGDLICLKVEHPKAKVVLWDSQREKGAPSYENIYDVAGSFSEFLAEIHEYDPLKA